MQQEKLQQHSGHQQEAGAEFIVICRILALRGSIGAAMVAILCIGVSCTRTTLMAFGTATTAPTPLWWSRVSFLG